MPRGSTRLETWEDMAYSDSYEASEDGRERGTAKSQDKSQLLTVGEVQKIVYPLQATAARVGKQVEIFAETLDRLSKTREKRATDCRIVLPLVQEYERIAAETVIRLKKYHEPERQEKLKLSLRSKLRKTDAAPLMSEPCNKGERGDLSSTTVEDLEHWQQEEQTWQLLGLMLRVRFPVQGDDSIKYELEDRFRRPKNAPKLHQYSSEHDVWNSFLEQNSIMWEKHVVVEWLKSCAVSTGQQFDNLVEELESDADRGSGLTAHGWLYSKEAIKGQKRLRSWPQPLDPNSPGIDSAFARADKIQGLVTQLDPDAFSRQGRTLEQEDIFFEQAIWMACWEMLRRGYSWRTIKEFCQDRVEIWRALSIRGDPRLSYQDSGTREAISGWQSRAIWRKMCSSVAQTGGIDDYENAVYGLLSGDLPSMEKISHGWDDCLFAVYNAQLVQGFDAYTRKAFSHHLPWDVLDKHSKSNLVNALTPSEHDGQDVWQNLRKRDSIKAEANSPLKMLQGSIIAKCAPSYLATEGLGLEYLILQEDPTWAGLMGTSKPEPSRSKHPKSHVGPKDYDMLRILTHVALIFQSLGSLPAESGSIETIIMAYIDFLGKAGKQQLLPLYASYLSPKAAVHSMARQLPFIHESGERSTLIKLMKQNQLDIPSILYMQLLLITSNSSVESPPPGSFPPIRILSKYKSRDTLPLIEKDFVGEDISGDENDLVNGFEWYLLLEGHWKDTMKAGATVYKYLLLTGAWAAARELARKVPFSAISMNKTGDILGQPVDLGVFSDEEDYDDSSRTLGTNQGRNPATESDIKLRKEYLLTVAATFRDLESLVLALDAIEYYNKVAEDKPEDDPSHARAWKAELQRAHNAVVEYVELLFGNWAQTPTNDDEAEELATIRMQYLPEIVLAYNTILNISGQFLSREHLLKTMDLAARVAAEDAELAACFVQAGRMTELVDALAVSAKTMVRGEEVARLKGKKGKRGGASAGLRLWCLGKEDFVKTE